MAGELQVAYSTSDDTGPAVLYEAKEVGFLKCSKVEVPDTLQKRWTCYPVKDGSMFLPKLNILDDESLSLDCPLEGGNLGYRLLKVLQLKYDISVDKVKAAAAVHAHNLVVVSWVLFYFYPSYLSVSCLHP